MSKERTGELGENVISFYQDLDESMGDLSMQEALSVLGIAELMMFDLKTHLYELLGQDRNTGEDDAEEESTEATSRVIN